MMKLAPENIYQSPNFLSQYYRNFDVSNRLLLNGHSHQAWPDCALEGQIQAFQDAATWIDQKWIRASEKAERVRKGYRTLLNDPDGLYTLSSSTHDLIVRFLSALPLSKRPKIVTTDGEFCSIRRQLQRLEEVGIQVQWIPTANAADIIPRLIEAMDDKTAVVMISAVLYKTGTIVPDLHELWNACQKVGAELLIDAYHSLNVIPFSLKDLCLTQAYIVGGGYKYCQLGEGNCFLRFPQDCSLRPVITGWFAEFTDSLKGLSAHERVSFPQNSERFSGGTYDPTSHYRAAAVFDFFERLDLRVELLREVSQHQIHLLCEEFDQLDCDPSIIARNNEIPLTQHGGFLALTTPHASHLQQRMISRGVFCDYRGDILRLGPAPYLSDDQLRQSMGILKEIIQDIRI